MRILQYLTWSQRLITKLVFESNDELDIKGQAVHGTPLRTKESQLKLSLKTRHLGDVMVVHCEGRIVYRDEAAALGRVVTEALKNTREVVVDLEGVHRIDSAGLGELARIRNAAQTSGGKLKLAGLNPRVMQLLRLTNLSSAFEIHASLMEALDARDELKQAV
jgi:anti-sigma B factor antagonist